MSMDMFPDAAIQHIIDWPYSQLIGLGDGQEDARAHYGDELTETIALAEGPGALDQSLSWDFRWLRDEGFLT